MWLFGVATAAHATWIGWYGWSLGLTAGNLVFNAYSILLQRYHRTRVRRVQRRLDRLFGALSAA